MTTVLRHYQGLKLSIIDSVAIMIVVLKSQMRLTNGNIKLTMLELQVRSLILFLQML